ncbi:hypothetical protein CHS0354_028316 [Potamilus streckersoni]|uniref:Uncharacterized protein n=1 Tax=Potamilus streckersoni TaxID=2493646 RepID=A0AAE0VJ40_9BIVA|nr:hypothetical protein CHS0354_028316 [Potamilus streckersoni]
MSSRESSPADWDPAGRMCLTPSRDMLPASPSGEVLIRNESPIDSDREVVNETEYESTSDDEVLSTVREELTCLRQEVEELRRREQQGHRCTIYTHGEGDSSRCVGYRCEQYSSPFENVNSNFENNMRQSPRESARTSLAARFKPVYQLELYRLAMKRRQRKRWESLNEQAQDVKHLANKAYTAAPVEVREQLALDCFLYDLNDTEMEWAVHYGKPKSMDNAAHLALEFESVLPIRTEEEIRPSVKIENFQLKMADGNLIPIKCCVTLPIKINGKVFQHRLVNADIQAPDVLGYDFLFEYECKIDVAESKLFIGGKSVQCLLESDLPRVCRITIMESVVVSASTEMIVQAKIDGKFGYATMAVIEADNFKLSEKDILIARSVVDPSSDRYFRSTLQNVSMYKCSLLFHD